MRRGVAVIAVALALGACSPSLAPPPGSWHAAGTLPADLNGPVLTTLDDGRVLAIGTPDATSRASKVLLFDPDRRTWSSLPSPPVAVDRATVTPLTDRRVLVAGGYGSMGSPISNSFLLDLSRGTWSVTASLRDPRAEASALRLPTGMVMVSGGFSTPRNAIPPQPSLSTAELFDPATGTWREAAPMAHGRADHASVLVGGRVIVLGGTDQIQAVGSSEEFDPETGSWSTLPDMPALRSAPTAFVLGGNIDVIGGTAVNSAGIFDPNPSLDVEILDTGSRTWSVGSPLQTFDRFPVLVDVVPLTDGRLFGILAGTQSAYTYDPGADVWAPATSTPRPSQIQPWLSGTSEAVALKDGEVLLVVGPSAQEFDPNGVRPDPASRGVLDSEATAEALGLIAGIVLLLLLLQRLRAQSAGTSP
jgi:hypothetical protein